MVVRNDIDLTRRSDLMGSTLWDDFIAYTGIFKQPYIGLRLEGTIPRSTITVADFLSHLHQRFAEGGPSYKQLHIRQFTREPGSVDLVSFLRQLAITSPDLRLLRMLDVPLACSSNFITMFQEIPWESFPRLIMLCLHAVLDCRLYRHRPDPSSTESAQSLMLRTAAVRRKFSASITASPLAPQLGNLEIICLPPANDTAILPSVDFAARLVYSIGGAKCVYTITPIDALHFASILSSAERRAAEWTKDVMARIERLRARPQPKGWAKRTSAGTSSSSD